jgi:hypothetical protein
MSELTDAEIEEIESVEGLTEALEMIAHAYNEAGRTGECVLLFQKTPSGFLNIMDITEHYQALEGE